MRKEKAGVVSAAKIKKRTLKGDCVRQCADGGCTTKNELPAKLVPQPGGGRRGYKTRGKRRREREIEGRRPSTYFKYMKTEQGCRLNLSTETKKHKKDLEDRG